MKDQIQKYKNRYGDDYYFEPVSENTYKFVFSALYVRAGYEGDEQSLSFIDPEGGPMISIGSMVNARKVKRIYFKDYYYLEVE
jgi:hypothetical protein